MKPTAVLSWIVILAIATIIPLSIHLRNKSASTQPISVESIEPQYQFAVKYLYGMGKLDSNSQARAMEQIDESSTAPIHKAAAAVVAAEFIGKEEAITRLKAVESPEAGSLEAWYESQTPIPGETVERLAYFGQLAQTYGQSDDAPARAPLVQSAKNAIFAGIGLMVLLVIAGIIGLGLMITGIVLLSMGKMSFRMTQPQGPAHVYVEAFMVYLLTYVLGSLVIGKWLPDAGMAIKMSPLVLGVVVALVWPILRGVRFSVQRADWGLHTGKNVFVEALWGVVGYLAGLPFIAIMAGIAIALTALTKTKPSHPIMTEIADHPWLVVLLAVVFAPLTEELLFRGAFLSHLRAGVGVVLSALINGLIFAAIHPQGWTLIPVLMGIGAVLAVIRQWRDTLVSSITAHALHNGVLVTLMLLLMR